MIKLVSSLLLLLGFQHGIAQSFDEVKHELENFHSMDDYDKFKTKHPGWYIQNQIFTLSDSLKTPEITIADIGDTFVQKYHQKPKILNKVIDIKEVERCKVQCVFLDGKQKSSSEIIKLRRYIIQQFRKGVPFSTLVKQYNMDGNKDGITGWFLKGKMDPEFERMVWNKSKGMIFTVDIPEKKWYYVIYKTHHNKKECALECITVDFEMRK